MVPRSRRWHTITNEENSLHQILFGTELQRLRLIDQGNRLRPRQIRYRTAQLQHPVIGPRGQLQLVHSSLQQCLYQTHLVHFLEFHLRRRHMNNNATHQRTEDALLVVRYGSGRAGA